MVPTILFDFNFDYILIMLFASYILYGYFSGGHKQIRFFINLVLPFMILYYLGRYITNYLYIPLSGTFLYEMIGEVLGFMKYTVGMIIAYILTYILLFVGIFILSIYARRYILNENMRAKLGKNNNYLGALFSLINGYVLVYFIILPVFSLNLIGPEAHVTNFVLEHPPPFSRIARTAEQAVPIKGLADKAEDFEQLLSVDGIEGYYNEAIYKYQQLYIGDSQSFEAQFMNDVYPYLSLDSKDYLDQQYGLYFDGEILSSQSYLGVSRVLVEEVGGTYVYESILETEQNFQEEYDAMQAIIQEYEDAQAQYEIDMENYDYTQALEVYNQALEAYVTYNEDYIEDKIQAYLNEETFNTPFTETRPTVSLPKPDGFVEVSDLPVVPEETQDITDATAFVTLYDDKVDVSEPLEDLGDNFLAHKGLLMWYVDELDRQLADTSSGDISEIIVSFKGYYDTMITEIDDEELEEKLYMAKMSIDSYDTFTSWLTCTLDHIDTIPLDDIELASSRCVAVDPSTITEYDFTDDALGLISTLFEGESVSWLIVQFKYDYEAGLFDDLADDYPEVEAVLESTKGLVDDYDTYYKDIANSIDGNVSMVVKIGISVMKYNFDAYETLEETPLLSAFANDVARLCSASTVSPLNRDVTICPMTEGEGAFKELFNMRYLASEVLFKAYIMVDDENQPKVYDSAEMEEFLAKVNTSVQTNVFSREVIQMFGDQFAFNVIDETNNYTLLQQMYDEGQISIEAMRILADDEYNLFSDEFSARVRSLIR
jgi:hypothetical protein